MKGSNYKAGNYGGDRTQPHRCQRCRERFWTAWAKAAHEAKRKGRLFVR